MNADLFKILPSMAVLCILGACAQPAVAPKEFAFQPSENTARDWNSVATHIADSMSQRGFLAPAANAQMSSATPAGYGRFYINVDAPGSTFLHEVRSDLQSEILARGGTIARSPADAAVVNLDVDVVHWGPRNTGPGGLGTITGLATGTGIVLAANAPYTAAAGFGMAAGAGIVADALASSVADTNVEAIWGATILKGGDVLMDVHEPVYVGRYDARLYESKTHTGAIESYSSPVGSVPVRLSYAP
jgi:hypothetical protein